MLSRFISKYMPGSDPPLGRPFIIARRKPDFSVEKTEGNLALRGTVSGGLHLRRDFLQKPAILGELRRGSRVGHLTSGLWPGALAIYSGKTKLCTLGWSSERKYLHH